MPDDSAAKLRKEVASARKEELTDQLKSTVVSSELGNLHIVQALQEALKEVVGHRATSMRLYVTDQDVSFLPLVSCSDARRTLPGARP